jgi:hypothetical protein
VAAVCNAAADDIVCAASELTCEGFESSASFACVSTFASAVSTLLGGVSPGWAGSTVSDFTVGLTDSWALAVGSGSASSVSLVCAPPVLTTTPGGAEVVVDPVDEDGVEGDGLDAVELDAVGVDVGPDVGSAGGVDTPEGSSDFPACGVLGPSDDEDEEGDDGDSAPGVSAHATLGPVSRTAPTPSATARDPTRPTSAAAFI